MPVVAARFGRRVDVLVNNASMFDAGDGALPDAAALVGYRVTSPRDRARPAGGRGRAMSNLDQRIGAARDTAYTPPEAAWRGDRTLAAVLAPACASMRCTGADAPTAICAGADRCAGGDDAARRAADAGGDRRGGVLPGGRPIEHRADPICRWRRGAGVFRARFRPSGARLSA